MRSTHPGWWEVMHGTIELTAQLYVIVLIACVIFRNIVTKQILIKSNMFYPFLVNAKPLWCFDRFNELFIL